MVYVIGVYSSHKISKALHLASTTGFYGMLVGITSVRQTNSGKFQSYRIHCRSTTSAQERPLNGQSKQ